MRWVRAAIVSVFVIAVGLPGSPAHAAPKPVSSCAYFATTDVVVTDDIGPCIGTAGIIVGKSGITIDLHGHRVVGDQSTGVSGIDVTDSSNNDSVTVENGVIERFDAGIAGKNGATGLHVSHVVASGNRTDGIFNDGNGAVIAASEVSGNGYDGILMYGSNHVVRSVDASGNRNDGIYIDGTAAHVIASRAYGNSGAGINITADSAVVRAAEGSGNGYQGIYIHGAHAHVASSRARGNGPPSSIIDGIQVVGDFARVASSSSNGNTGNGITLDGASARILSSSASGNDYDGIETIGDLPKIGELPGGRASDRNHADANGFADGSADGAGLGISAVGYTTPPVGRNRASGNDNMSECDPSTLC